MRRGNQRNVYVNLLRQIDRNGKSEVTESAIQANGTMKATDTPLVSMMYPVMAGGRAPPRFNAEIAQARTSVFRFSETERSANAKPEVSKGAIARPLRNKAKLRKMACLAPSRTRHLFC